MNSQYQDHFEFYTRGPYSQYVTETRSGGADPIRIIEASQPEGDFSDPAQPDIVLTEILHHSGHSARDFGLGRRRFRFRRGDLEVQPPGLATEILSEADHRVRVFVLPFDRLKTAIEADLPTFDGDFGPLHAAPFRNVFLGHICQCLWDESEAGNPHGDLFADGALLAMGATLLRLWDGARLDSVGTPFPDRLRTRIEEFLNASLDQNLAVRDLAALADTPEAAFTRSFKATFNQTPHQYVLTRRIARAQELLAAGDMPLAEIAYACGFASQSHMTDVFREKLGVTPGRYRKEVRG